VCLEHVSNRHVLSLSSSCRVQRRATADLTSSAAFSMNSATAAGCDT
jgi:hypothetical protein